MLSFFPRGVLDEILDLIESVSEGFSSYSSYLLLEINFFAGSKHLLPGAEVRKLVANLHT